jgi:hypothetical protein
MKYTLEMGSGFHKDWFWHSKVDRGDTQRQHSELLRQLLFLQSLESRLIIRGRFNKQGNKPSRVCNVPYFIQISCQVRAGRALLPLTVTRPRLISVILSQH